ncbi:RUN domain-containing protein 1-like isoform X2 [Copidosoma floridanum]|nr:RUN domain-containing protein 1-like isoform X2 [Copidosoma floridanum]
MDDESYEAAGASSAAGEVTLAEEDEGIEACISAAAALELDVFAEDNEGPSGKRWEPLGATANPDDDGYALEEYKHEYDKFESGHFGGMEKLRMLEEEQEMLNSSLIALTTHFAQVQFRLKQICDAPTNEKENLLKELEEFAFRGIPDVHGNVIFDTKSSISSPSHRRDSSGSDDRESKLKMEMQRAKQKELISQLKSQLEDLEQYAYETGDADLPQSIVLERQNLIISHLKEKLNVNIEDLSKLSPDDLRWQVDMAINQIVSPLKMKEQLITQLKTQITDLERFINYLQGEVSTETLACTCACPVHTHGQAQPYKAKRSFNPTSANDNSAASLSTVGKVVALLHMYIMSQIGCGGQRPHHSRKKESVYGWRDLRTRLDISVEHVLEVLAESEYRSSIHEDVAYNSDSDSPVSHYNVKITSAVRKHLALCIRDLMQHGATTDATATSVVPFVGCFATRTHSTGSSMHAWEIILKYYEVKNGRRYNSSPAQKLSQSFNLDLHRGQSAS